jgi:chromatin segregation and condensation protein Rec8/ScpA/Scc1 (kleisin family)
MVIYGVAVKKVNIPKLIEEKIKMLRKDFLIEPTEEEIAHLKELKTEQQVETYVRIIINTHWEE